MNNLVLVKKYFQLQKLVGFFNEIAETSTATLVFSSEDKSTYANLAWINRPISLSSLKEVEQIFKFKDRTPAVCFEKRIASEELEKFLIDEGYKKDYEEVWLFFQKDEIEVSRFEQVKTIKTEEDLETFLQIFDQSYQRDDPQNPYGPVTKYLEKVKTAWMNHQKGEIEYYLAYKDNRPVAVSALTNFEDVGYISDVGSLKDIRGEGFGKLVTLFAVAQSMKRGNKQHFLITEEGSYPHELYKRIGFKTKFTAVCFAKNTATYPNEFGAKLDVG